MELLMLRQSQCTSGRSTGLETTNRSQAEQCGVGVCCRGGVFVCCTVVVVISIIIILIISATVVLLIFFCSGSSSTHHKTLTICLLEVKTSSGKKVKGAIRSVARINREMIAIILHVFLFENYSFSLQ